VLSGGYASVKIAGTNCKAGTYTANPGDALIITALKTGNRSAVVVNGETVVPQTSNKFTYEHIITGNVALVFKMQEINSLITSVYEITSS
jgi:hypothetical protein